MMRWGINKELLRLWIESFLLPGVLIVLQYDDVFNSAAKTTYYQTYTSIDIQ